MERGAGWARALAEMAQSDGGGTGWARAPTGEAQSGGGGAVGFLWSHFVRSWVNTGRVRFGVDHDRGAHFDTWWCDAGGTPGDFVVDRGRVDEVAVAIHSPSRYGWPSGIYTAALILFLEGVQSYSYAPEQFDGGCGDKTAVHGNSMRRGAPVPETSCALGPTTRHVCLLGLVMSPQTKLGSWLRSFPYAPSPGRSPLALGTLTAGRPRPNRRRATASSGGGGAVRWSEEQGGHEH